MDRKVARRCRQFGVDKATAWKTALNKNFSAENVAPFTGCCKSGATAGAQKRRKLANTAQQAAVDSAAAEDCINFDVTFHPCAQYTWRHSGSDRNSLFSTTLTRYSEEDTVMLKIARHFRATLFALIGQAYGSRKAIKDAGISQNWQVHRATRIFKD